MCCNDNKVKFKTSRFGSIEVNSDKVISFPDGIVGFSSIKRYVLIDHKDTVLKWLQAADDPDVAFIVVEPTVLLQNFNMSLDPTTKRFLQLENNDDLVTLVIIRVENERVIANFHGPLLFNASLKVGVQVVLDKI
ncbi:flagellar assembly protein FliW [Candidatus Magnetominusculus xianensis]|uniref:Flagellar assembly factor FliW n=1 Tax=Candidatus Magnetominusculus xianensis TaxID=1748249 RepID=A0ABR5SF08_9BACT|nr:flagellar assembly protein FliW [Candidatus Magnetominusculus xianensis]KWT85379.1 flagellar assembly protein FliW [Candidatus Magnetominusculus xianensis]MBF0405142.1 flagellar assembly protein FliW [Nitrospirota bacterium]